MTTTPQTIVDISSRGQRAALNPSQRPALLLFAVGMVGLGVLALAVGDFAMVWQPVPPGFAARAALAYASGVLMIACGGGLLLGATRTWAVRVLFPYLIAWQLLKVPSLFAAPKLEAVYLGFGELAVLLAGGWTLFALLSEVRPPAWLAWATGERGASLARYYFAVWIIPIGLSHLIYTKETVALVPAWLPYRTGWAYLTGAGQIASGLGILFGVLPRAAAWAEAGQISLYTLLIWVPAVMAAPKARLPWTAMWISWAIAAGAWVVALHTARQVPRAEEERAPHVAAPKAMQ